MSDSYTEQIYITTMQYPTETTEGKINIEIKVPEIIEDSNNE